VKNKEKERKRKKHSTSRVERGKEGETMHGKK
jgi:hypothetical protein